MNPRRLAPLVAIVLLAAACGGTATPTEVGSGPTTTVATSTTTASPTTTADPTSPEARLAAARGLWAVNGLDSYSIETRQSCFCPQVSWVDTVVNGKVVSHEPTTQDAFFDPGARTMQDLFDEIDAAMSEGYASIDLQFDSSTGALTSWWVDVSEMMADEEHGVTVVSLETIPDSVDVSLLADDYGCGYGFAKGSADQSLAVRISSKDSGPGDGPAIQGPITLPDPSWTAEVVDGANLFSNWCNDVIQTSDPIPVTIQTWTIVAGTLTINQLAADGSTTGLLTGAIAESSTGVRVPLDDIALANDCWGCFAG